MLLCGVDVFRRALAEFLKIWTITKSRKLRLRLKIVNALVLELFGIEKVEIVLELELVGNAQCKWWLVADENSCFEGADEWG